MQKHSNMIIINVCPDCVQLYNPSSLGPIWVYMLSSSYISKMWKEEQWGPWHATREVGYCKIRESTFLDSIDCVVVRVGPRHGGQFPEHGVTTWDWDLDMVNLTRTAPSPVGVTPHQLFSVVVEYLSPRHPRQHFLMVRLQYKL